MTLREALQAVYDREGMLTPALVVEIARDGKDAVAQRLAEALPWDPDEALEKYQLVVAAKLIRKQRIVYKPTPRSALRPTRQWVSVASPEGRSYKPIREVAADPLASRLLLAEAERAWRELKARYGNIAGFVEMIRRDLDEQDKAA